MSIQTIQLQNSIQKLTVDAENKCLYLQFSSNKIKRTVEFDDDTNIDIDSKGHVVGIEIIGSLKSKEPQFIEMAKQYHQPLFKTLPSKVRRQLAAV